MLPGFVVAGKDNGTVNITPESQPPDRPETTLTLFANDPNDLKGNEFLATPGYFILLDQSHDTTQVIPEGDPNNKAMGVRSPIEINHPEDWSDVVYFQPLAGDPTRSDRALYASNPEGIDGEDTGSILDSLTAAGIPQPTANDNVAFLFERTTPGEASDSNAVHKYDSGNVIYNVHSDPTTVVPEPAALALFLTGLAPLGLMAMLRRRSVIEAA